VQNLSEIRSGQSVRRHQICFGHVPPTPDLLQTMILT